MGTQVIRVFVFDKPVPDPFKEWHLFAGTAAGRARRGCQADGDIRQISSALRRPAQPSGTSSARCSEIVWGCIEQWGGEEVKDWYWCIWNEPNNPIVGGDLTFAQYRRIYEDVGRGHPAAAGTASRRPQGP